MSLWRDHCPAPQGKTFQENVDAILSGGGVVTLSTSPDRANNFIFVNAIVQPSGKTSTEGIARTIEEAIERALGDQAKG
jgi:hypothetical protein